MDIGTFSRCITIYTEILKPHHTNGEEPTLTKLCKYLADITQGENYHKSK